MLNAPFLLDNQKIVAEFPADAVARAKQILTKLPGGVGAYQDSRGSPFIRQEIAEFLRQRDGYPANPEVSLAQSHVHPVTDQEWCIRFASWLDDS